MKQHQNVPSSTSWFVTKRVYQNNFVSLNYFALLIESYKGKQNSNSRIKEIWVKNIEIWHLTTNVTFNKRWLPPTTSSQTVWADFVVICLHNVRNLILYAYLMVCKILCGALRTELIVTWHEHQTCFHLNGAGLMWVCIQILTGFEPFEFYREILFSLRLSDNLSLGVIYEISENKAEGVLFTQLLVSKSLILAAEKCSISTTKKIIFVKITISLLLAQKLYLLFYCLIFILIESY